MNIIEKIRFWLMVRYCPEFEAKMPEDEVGEWCAEAIVVYGYWGNKYRVVASKRVSGLRKAYITARWLALKAQWLRPAWLFSCGINYGVRDAKSGAGVCFEIGDNARSKGGSMPVSSNG